VPLVGFELTTYRLQVCKYIYSAMLIGILKSSKKPYL